MLANAARKKNLKEREAALGNCLFVCIALCLSCSLALSPLSLSSLPLLCLTLSLSLVGNMLATSSSAPLSRLEKNLDRNL